MNHDIKQPTSCYLDGFVEGERAFSHIAIDVQGERSMRGFVAHTKKSQEAYFRGCGV